jgi:hypothetical protein
LFIRDEGFEGFGSGFRNGPGRAVPAIEPAVDLARIDLRRARRTRRNEAERPGRHTGSLRSGLGCEVETPRALAEHGDDGRLQEGPGERVVIEGRACVGAIGQPQTDAAAEGVRKVEAEQEAGRGRVGRDRGGREDALLVGLHLVVQADDRSPHAEARAEIDARERGAEARQDPGADRVHAAQVAGDVGL